ncbi:MAG TPA: M15 family metallopeptidase [Candidatus Angelobacter sp.]|nr:M15 family metallopeptidase [Candidatus Angelobacter sp.]
MRTESTSVVAQPLVRTGLLLLLVVSASRSQTTNSLQPGPQPSDISAQQKAWVGEYGPDGPMLNTVAEKNGKLVLFGKLLGQCELSQKSPTELVAACPSKPNVTLHKDSSGALYLRTDAWNFKRRDFGVDATLVARIKPVRPVEELRSEALAATPPEEKGQFRVTDLVELSRLDPSIHLDIRYATANDFLGTPVYSQARAFLQRPAAEALLRVQQKLKPLGYGLLIHDAYRPWYVTKIFWEATPPEGKIFVADPAQGSRHNRGCAVDLTLYDLASGKPIEMPGTYDEMSPRSFPDYPGGTSLQRWHRDLLRRAMESEGFTVYEAEWWHFDYKDWKEYPIQNIPFEKLGLGPGSTPVH